jgi:hypothetical protein
MKRYITYPRVAGVASRQAHADLPPGTFEREMSKDGFFGPAAHLYHRHPPTGWVQFAGPCGRTRLILPPCPRRRARTVGRRRDRRQCGAAAALLEERRRPHGPPGPQRRRR